MERLGAASDSDMVVAANGATVIERRTPSRRHDRPPLFLLQTAGFTDIFPSSAGLFFLHLLLNLFRLPLVSLLFWRFHL